MQRATRPSGGFYQNFKLGNFVDDSAATLCTITVHHECYRDVTLSPYARSLSPRGKMDAEALILDLCATSSGFIW